jgi:hypothetical protein
MSSQRMNERIERFCRKPSNHWAALAQALREVVLLARLVSNVKQNTLRASGR